MAVSVESRRGTVSELHGLDPLADVVTEPMVWWCDPTDAAIVLGSRQQPELLDASRCDAAGLSIVRRRSGGGLVLLRPGAMAWFDVILPPSRLPDDVRGSMVWIGERWAEVLADRVAGELAVHDGGMLCTPWSGLVCFAGIGPGEVLLDGRKLVGLSQRRSRRGIRIQSMLHRRPLVGEVPELIVGDLPPGAPAEPAVLDDASSLDDEALAHALAAALAQAPARPG
jgi:lipoate-protein ligase A